MIEKLAQKIYTYMSSHTKTDTDLEDIYRYGIEITLSTALNFLLIIVISVFFNSPLSGICHICCLLFLRSFCGGYHADSYLKCNSLMVVFFVIAYLGSKLLDYYNLADVRLLAIILIVAFLPILAFAPVKNKHKSLSERKTKKCRILSIVIYTIFSVLGLYLTYIDLLYGLIIIITLIEISVSVLIEILMQRRE